MSARPRSHFVPLASLYLLAMEPAKLSRKSLSAFRQALLQYYDKCHRSLPWRDENDPYRILVSEVMLQQTRVETVQEYYRRWLKQFPDLQSLAAADSHEVLKAWEGLGYYRRARRLHETARLIVERRDATVPRTLGGLRELPGVGEYTAGAVASIAFGEAVPAVDGNVRRVLSRIFDVPDPRPSWLRVTASGLIDRDRPGDWNQALMELGATVCAPRRPRCDMCPVSTWCLARQAGTESDRPTRSKRSRPKRIQLALAVLYDGQQVFLVRRFLDGLLGGMWAFPESEVSGVSDGETGARAAALSRGISVLGAGQPLPTCRHRFTHLEATYHPFAFRSAVSPAEDGAAWVSATAPMGFALPTAQKKVLASFVEHIL